MSRTPCALPPPSSSSKASTPTAASAATKNADSAPKRSARPPPTPSPASARISGGSTTDRSSAHDRYLMKRIHYSRYTGDDLGIGAEELLDALADFLLESGFNTQYMPFSEFNQHTLEELKKAIQAALEQGKLFDNERLQEMMDRIRNMTPEQMD